MKRKILSIVMCTLVIATVLPVAGALNDQTIWSAKENSYSEPMSPGVIGIRIFAKVFDVYDIANLLGGSIQINDVITGKYVYDSGTLDTNPDPIQGDYPHSSSSFGIKIYAGGFVFQTNPNDVDFIISIRNNYSTPPSDYYGLASGKNIQLSNGMLVNLIWWMTADPSGLSFSSDALPTFALDMNNWYQDDQYCLVIMGQHPSDSSKTFTILATVTKTIKSNMVDISDAESNLATLMSTMPYYHHLLLRFWERIFERFPNAFPILRHLMGY